MKVVLEGTNHSKNEEETEVSIEYIIEDDWTFWFNKTCITISNLTEAMDFLRKEG